MRLPVPLALAVLAGCSVAPTIEVSDGSQPDGPRPSGTAEASAPRSDAGAEAGEACTTLVNVGEVVVPVMTAPTASPPPPVGGPITPGFYVLSAIYLYRTTPDCALHDELVAPGSFTERITVESPAQGLIEQAGAPLRPNIIANNVRRYSLAGTNMTLTAVCPGFGSDTVGYSAAENELVTTEDHHGVGCGTALVVRRRLSTVP